MIRKRGAFPSAAAEVSHVEPAPWEGAAALGRLALLTLWATGPDPRRDHVFRVQALRRGPDGEGWERLDRWCRPPANAEGGGTGAAASARMRRDFGVGSADLEEAEAVEEVWHALADFLGERTVLVGERARALGWAIDRGAGEAPPFRILDLVGLAGLLRPGRLAAAGEMLPARLLGSTGHLVRHPLAIGPEELHGALGHLVGALLEADEASLALAARGFEAVWLGLHRTAPTAAEELAFVLRLCEHPSRWRDAPEGLFPPRASLTDGRLSDALRAYPTVTAAVDAATPGWIRREEEEGPGTPLRAGLEEEAPLSGADRRVLDEIFQEHLPRRFATPGETTPSYREGQHQTALETGAALGVRELLLMHAPTGTGKTLAYLVPALLWSFRNRTRIGVATFTRALQEQAMDRDVPLAREVLRRAGVTAQEDELRVTVLKGRANYLCWRALRLQAPLPGLPPADHLAWVTLALFGLFDPDGDLDRFPRRSPLPALEQRDWATGLETLLRLVRAESGCCTRPADRHTCGADAARRRAERSHVVITNHAFALARREFFRHLVFDECEHLHDVAHSAFSHFIAIRALKRLLERFQGGRGRRQGPLERVAEVASDGSAAWLSVHACLEACALAVAFLGRLADAVTDFKLWREDVGGGRPDAETHSLFREFVLEGESQELLEAHAQLTQSLNNLSAGLAGLAEHLDTLPTRGIQRIRRSLSVLRAELEEMLEGVEAWIPREDDGRPKFGRETFHDVETRPAGGDVLATRVLLPHEFLGRHYYPELFGAVFLSATTWLRGGFDTAATYLGLERARHPDSDEDREPSVVRTFRAPEAFDYGRVLVCTPRDAPSVSRDKRGFLDYVARFTGYLAERTRGRILVLYTNADDLTRTGRQLEGFFSALHLPFWYQRMEGTAKEELGELFRSHTDSVLFGLDTFWYGADFPGPTLEYLVLVRLPYGVPDRYHHAQSAALGSSDQRRQIYMPRALAKFRQGFGRLMRKTTDRGCIFLLDSRVTEPRHRMFLRELPLAGFAPDAAADGLSTLVRGDTDHCLHAAFAHQELLTDIERRGLQQPFAGWRIPGGGGFDGPSSTEAWSPPPIAMEPPPSTARPCNPQPVDSPPPDPRPPVSEDHIPF